MKITEKELHFCVQVTRLASRLEYTMRSQAGCVIWDNRNNNIVSFGYKTESEHAEKMALKRLSVWKKCTGNFTMFLTTSPCSICAANLARIPSLKTIYYLDAQTNLDGIRILQKRKKKVRRLI